MDANERRIVGPAPGELSHTPISDSCYRTCRFHIGTVALAAFLIAVVEFMRACVLYIEHKMNQAAGGKPNCCIRAVFCLTHCCLACLQVSGRAREMEHAVRGREGSLTSFCPAVLCLFRE